MAVLTCRVLGPPEVTVDGGAAPPELLWRKHLVLLVYLACSPRRTRGREHLIGLLWPDRLEAAARHSLNEALRVLRRAVGPGLDVVASQVRLSAEAVRLDIDEFQALASAGRWDAAAALVHGEFLEGFGIADAPAFEDWLAAERTRWRSRAVDALTRSAAALTAAGALESAMAAAHRALSLDAHADRAVRELMRAATFNGNKGEALAAYAAFSTRLREELATDPDPETAALAERIRRERIGRPPEPRSSRAIHRRPPLVGRARELGTLLELWQQCRTGSRLAFGIIEGEHGTGKTRLLDEVAVRARLDGGVAATVRAVEADATVPFGTLLALARSGLAGAPGVAAAPAPALAAFAAYLPEWAERFPGACAAAAAPLPRALVEVVRAALQERPVLLGVDDAHWADRDSILALDALAREPEPGPLACLVTTTPHDHSVALDELRRRCGAERPAAAVRLGPLDIADLAALVRWACPRFAPDEVDRLTRRIAHDSAGLPIFAVELVHAVAAGLELTPTPAAWPAPERTLDHTLPTDLPDSIVAAIRIGFRRLSPEAQAVGAAAAVLDDRVTSAALATVTGLPLPTVVGALDELEWYRWLQAEPRGYSFVARIARHVIGRDMLTPGQRQRIQADTRAT